MPQLQAAIYYAREELDSVRILCAPCSTGDEAYSLGMLARSNLLDVNRVSIVGININSDAIDSCKKGVYSERSLHRLNDNQKKYLLHKTRRQVRNQARDAA